MLAAMVVRVLGHLGYLATLLLVGCGDTAPQTLIQNGGAGGGGAAHAAGSSATSSGSGGDGGAPSDGSGVAGGGGTSNAAGAGCDGLLLGSWSAETAPLVTAPPDDVDDCYDLELLRGDGYVHAYWWLSYQAVPRRLYFYASTLAANAEGEFFITQAFEGPLTQEFAAECMVDDQGQTVTCEELEQAIGLTIPSEQTWTEVACSPGAGGGCSCQFAMLQRGGFGGRWSPTNPRLAVFEWPSVQNPSYMEMASVPYCSGADGLTFGAEMDKVFPNSAGVLLAPVDCADGVQGPGERGIDCDGACSATCE